MHHISNVSYICYMHKHKKLKEVIRVKEVSIMPKGTPNAQTKATEKYQKRVGLINKSYKLKKEVVEEFKETCNELGVSQASALTSLMQQFITENKTVQ
nr:MAG TPA: hypothetical protein [Caudoviricetes sp.]